MHVDRLPLAVTALLLVVGCAPADDGEDEEGLGEAAQETWSSNALVPNAINPNAIDASALDPGALGGAPLRVATLGAGSLAAITDPGEAGDLSRQFLRYAVSCAFKPTQSFAFSWSDAKGVVHDEVYGGDLGVAPSWQMQPLNVKGQEWVTACLAARTNWYGTSVVISMRSGMPSTPASDAEMAAYPHEEGAFWGNLFTATPLVRSCYWTQNTALAHAAYRDCAAGHLDSWGNALECGPIHIVGACDTYCGPKKGADGHHPHCTVDPAVSLTKKTVRVMTVFLP